MGENKKLNEEKTLDKCPLKLDNKVEELRELFDANARILHDIAFIKVNTGESDIDGKPKQKEYHISEILLWVLEATETKRKILQTERIWKKSKWIIVTLTFIRKSILPLLLTAILGVLFRIAISYVKFENYIIENEKHILNNENMIKQNQTDIKELMKK